MVKFLMAVARRNLDIGHGQKTYGTLWVNSRQVDRLGFEFISHINRDVSRRYEWATYRHFPVSPLVFRRALVAGRSYALITTYFVYFVAKQQF